MTDGLQTNELGVIVSAKVVTAKKRETVYRRKITGIYDSLSHYRSVCVRQIKRYRGVPSFFYTRYSMLYAQQV